MEGIKLSLTDRIKNFFGLYIPKEIIKGSSGSYNIPDTTQGMPIRAGRQTEPVSTANNILDSTTIKPDFPPEFLDALQILASVNPDISYAVDNIVQLANTEYTISFGDASDEEANRMRKALTESAKGWYGDLTNRTTLVASMIDQLAVNGVLSYEIIVKEDLSGIESIILVNPRNIEFKYDKEGHFWQPYQRVRGLGLGRNLVDGALLKLNTKTYKYIPLRVRGEKPYGIPPFLSALEITDTEIDIIKNFKKVSKNIGVLGFLEILVNRPVRRKSAAGEFMEDETEYMNRCVQYLNTVVRPEAEKGFDTGVMTGFKQDFETKFENTNSQNLSGTEKFIEILTVQKHAGLKQNPIFLGRPFNTSEALGRVLLDLFASQGMGYQGVEACALQDIFKLELILQGFPVVDVLVEFKSPQVKDEVKVQEAWGKKIENLDMLYNQGIVSQQKRANLLGYDEPDQDTPRVVETTQVQVEEDTQTNTLMEELGWLHAEFDYSICGCSHMQLQGDDDNENLDKFIRGYGKAMLSAYQRAVRSISKKIGLKVLNMRQSATRSEVFDAVYATIIRNWRKDFVADQAAIINKWLDAAYKSFRSSKDIFGGKKIKDADGNPTNIPASTFDRIDVRTLSYMKKGDRLYMGKFITDDDTVKRLQDFIFEEFAKGDIPLGQTRGQKQFIENMAVQLNIEQFKIERIVRTTTNKLRSYASINYMDQVGVLKYQVLAVIDNKTSTICRKMNGKEFSVSASRARVLQVIKSQPSSVPTVTPFVSSIFKTSELGKLDNLTGDVLLSTHKIFAPPYHGNCRTQIIAIL